jgi:hypothetical protein
MISDENLHDLIEKHVKTKDSYSSKIICNEPSVSCYQGDYELCPETKNLIRNTELRFEDDNIDNITYRQWMTSDISTMETTVQSCSDFKSTFLKS